MVKGSIAQVLVAVGTPAPGGAVSASGAGVLLSDGELLDLGEVDDGVWGFARAAGEHTAAVAASAIVSRADTLGLLVEIPAGGGAARCDVSGAVAGARDAGFAGSAGLVTGAAVRGVGVSVYAPASAGIEARRAGASAIRAGFARGARLVAVAAVAVVGLGIDAHTLAGG